MSEEEARKYFSQLIKAVTHMHAEGIVHRDLKPENILLMGDQLKVADFGLSSIILDGAGLKTSCGSPNYAAPEVIEGQSYDGTQADVWSCGVILYALLTRSLPFEAESLSSLFNQIKIAQFTMPASIS
jgi:serine/threonine protein kinase